MVAEGKSITGSPVAQKPIIGNVVERKPIIGKVVERKPTRAQAVKPADSTPTVKPEESAGLEMASLSITEPSLKDEIGRENASLIASLSPSELAEYQEWIGSNLSPSSIRFLQTRKR